MIEVYLVPTANGQKVAILLEELELPYRAHRIVRRPGDVPSAAYRRISPLGKYPAIVDSSGPDGPLSVFETMAIALYLTEKTGRLCPTNVDDRSQAHAWAAVAASDLTPMMATQYFLTLRATSDVSEATNWVVAEAHRCLAAIDARLDAARFLAGDAYSYADVLMYPLMATSVQRLEGWFGGYRHIVRWYDEIAARPAVQRGMKAAQQD